ncbi:hypothetical protein [Agrococcus jejuensis]|uniref:hypothetical protein n=1 Tax=Agrococcus jejuensis TaxID=399736 RepID=UPI0011A1A83B|nr:hypothetical protein [Agrococcus jejuensis]
MTVLREPRPRLPRRVLLAALLAGAVGGAMLGAGLSLSNLVVVALAVATLVGAGTGLLSIMWGPPGDVLDDEALVELAVPLATAGGAGAVVGAASFVALWLLLRRRVPAPGAVVGLSSATVAVAMLVLGTVTTAAFVPALTLIGGPPAVPQAVTLAVLLGLVGAPLGALATWWMTWLLRARRIATTAQAEPASPIA